jgi:zinc transporter
MAVDKQTTSSCSFVISADGDATRLTELPTSAVSPDAAFVWTHLHVRQEGAGEWLAEEAQLEPSVVDAMLAEDTRPRAAIKADGVMIILRAVNLHEGEAPEEMISLRMWIDERRVITTRIRDTKAVEEIQASIAKGESPTSPAELLKSITSRMLARMEPFLEELEDGIAAVEEQIAAGLDLDLGDRLFPIRRRVTIFRRYMTPQKTVFAKLHDHPISCLCSADQQHFGEELDRVTRYAEELDELAARSQIFTEEARNIHAEKLNKLAYIFSVVATIFLPLGFLTGLLGVNLGGIPGADNAYAFGILSAICAGLVVVQVAFFRKLKWF